MLAKSKLTANPKRQIDSFLAKYDPAVAAFARRVLVRMRKRFCSGPSRWSMTTTMVW